MSICRSMIIGVCGLVDGEGASRKLPELSRELVHYKKHCMVSACCVSEIM